MSVDRFVFLGDVVGTEEHMEETIGMLDEIQADSIYGNHDFKLRFSRFPEALDDAALTFEATDHRVILTGHLHGWHAVRDRQLMEWSGTEPLTLDPDSRYLIVVGAVCERRYAMLDTLNWQLIPYDLEQ